MHERSYRRAFDGTGPRGIKGKLNCLESVTLLGATSQVHIDAKIVSGTGGFAGARGTAAFDGKANAVTGSGTYAGKWCAPALGAC